jgi:hypothetical protein
MTVGPSADIEFQIGHTLATVTVSHTVLACGAYEPDDEHLAAFAELLRIRRTGHPACADGLHAGLFGLVHRAVQALGVPVGAFSSDPTLTQPAARIGALRGTVPAASHQMLLVAMRTPNREEFILRFAGTFLTADELDDQRIVAFSAAVAAIRLVFEQHAEDSLASRWGLLAQLTFGVPRVRQ